MNRIKIDPFISGKSTASGPFLYAFSGELLTYFAEENQSFDSQNCRERLFLFFVPPNILAIGVSYLTNSVPNHISTRAGQQEKYYNSWTRPWKSIKLEYYSGLWEDPCVFDGFEFTFNLFAHIRNVNI